MLVELFEGYDSDREVQLVIGGKVQPAPQVKRVFLHDDHRIALSTKAGSHWMRFNSFKVRPSFNHPGMIRIIFYLQPSQKRKMSQIRVLVSPTEALCFGTDKSSNLSLVLDMRTVLRETVIRMASNVEKAVIPQEDDKCASFNQSAVESYDEPWRYSPDKIGWKCRRVREGVPSLGTYVILSLNGIAFEYEKRSYAKEAAMKVAEAQRFKIAVCYVSGHAVLPASPKVEWHEPQGKRETSD